MEKAVITSAFSTLRNIVEGELKQALEKHGGSVDWGDDWDDCPIVACNPDTSEPEPCDVLITKVWLAGNFIRVKAVNKLTHEDVKVGIGDIFIEHIPFITDEIS